MDKLNQERSDVAGQDLTALAGTPFVYHCHHFNLFHDQTVEDALGEEQAFRVRSQAAQDNAHQFLSGLAEATGASTPAERLELAAAVFPWMGQGRLETLGDASGGEARGEFLHYSFSWREKYGQKVRRLTPIDAFGSGFAAAALEVAHNLPARTLVATETECHALKDPACKMAFVRNRDATDSPQPVSMDQCTNTLTQPFGGLDEERIATIAEGLKGFVKTVSGDERGLMDAFGVYVTLHLSGYYNQTAYETLHQVETTAPQSLPMAEELFGESGHVCVFNTFGNILLSPEWEGMVGPLSGDIEDTVSYCCAIARGLGFGHWTLQELVPHERLVLRASSNYEAPFYLSRYGRSQRPRSYVFANAARAIMQLAHRIDWKARPKLTGELYNSLFREGQSWVMDQTACLTRGDDFCEVVVTSA